jgi:WD40 repeat protein
LSLAASKDGRRVAEIRSWNRELRVVVRDLDRKADDVAGTRWVFSSIRSAPAAGCFAFDTQGDEKGIEIVRWSDLRTLAFIPCADAYAWDLAPDGKHLFAGVPGGIAKIETATGREMARASPHRAWIGGYAFHPDGQSIVTVGPDGFVHFRAVDDGRELGAFRPEGGASGEFDMSRDGAFMVSVRSNELLLCDLGQRKVLRRIPREDVRCSGVTFAMPDVVLVAEGFGGVRAYDTSGRAPTRWIVESLTPQRYAGDTSHSDWSAASFSPDGSLVARTVWGHGIDVYETATGTRRFTIAERPDFGLAFSHDASRLLYSTVGGVVKAVDAKTGHELSSAAVGGSDLRITADPTGRYAAVASGDTIALLHAPTMKEVTRFEVRNHWRVRFSPKGETLAVSVRDAMLLYDLNLPVQSGK